ncbi:hypothetical protein MMC12_003137 [Toensbergia leucococca]|nr:hypothetical protein [Toensbergia leucococca]
MDPIFKFPVSPGTPLFPVSPERANRQPLHHSPSLPSDLSHSQNDPFAISQSSDVQGKVAQFNNLSKEAVQRRKDNEAAVRRAVLGREEAESEVKRLREENRRLRKDVDEGRGRERRVGERVEGVMEELQRMTETHLHSQALYEKEVRRARKEAFKSSSALVKAQEELKTTRNRFTLMREEVEVQRRKVGEKEQQTFAAEYQLVGVQQELDQMAQQVKTIQEERDSLKTSLKEEEVARIAAEGHIALPASSIEDEFSSPKKKKKRSPRRSSLKENYDPNDPASDDEEAFPSLTMLLWHERGLRRDAYGIADTLLVDCHLKQCPCRLAEARGTEYAYDDRYSAASEYQRRYPVDSRELPPELPHIEYQPLPLTEHVPRTPTEQPLSPPSLDSSPLINFSPIKSIYTLPSAPLSQPSLPQSPTLDLASPTPTTRPPTTRTTTTIIPLAPSTPLQVPPSSLINFTPIPTTPATMSREAALEQIRLRRGRARSIAIKGTPRGEGGLRRDVSAPVTGGRGG